MNPLTTLLLATGVIALAVLIWWPERGVLARWRRTRSRAEHVYREDALKHIHKSHINGRRPTLESIAGVIHLSLNETAAILADMQVDELLRIAEGEIALTAKGRESALHIIRAHRLWERYLAEETGWEEASWHGQAEEMEHRLQPAELDALSAQLGFPTHDPHGDPIPDRTGQLMAYDSQTLTTLDADTPARIVHLEDEPETVYAQLVAEGLYPGQIVRLIGSSPERVRFWAGGNEHILAPIMAENIHVVLLPEMTEVDLDKKERLGSLPPGATAEVVALSPTCRGSERRRLLDLGLTPGTVVQAEFQSPGGDPTAYRIRGALIALRQEQADRIQIKLMEA